MKLPLKFRILQMIAAEQVISNREVARKIALEYSGERQAHEKVVTDHLTAFETTGMIACRAVAVGRDGCLEEELVVTSYGLTRLKYLPKRAKPSETS